jgi:putative FmdB family regulatory protein
MARYDYKCTECGTTFEVEHPMSAHPKVSCPSCGSPAKQVFDSYGIEFRGSGYYNTDQKDKK